MRRHFCHRDAVGLDEHLTAGHNLAALDAERRNPRIEGQRDRCPLDVALGCGGERPQPCELCFQDLALGRDQVERIDLRLHFLALGKGIALLPVKHRARCRAPCRELALALKLGGREFERLALDSERRAGVCLPRLEFGELRLGRQDIRLRPGKRQIVVGAVDAKQDGSGAKGLADFKLWVHLDNPAADLGDRLPRCARLDGAVTEGARNDRDDGSFNDPYRACGLACSRVFRVRLCANQPSEGGDAESQGNEQKPAMRGAGGKRS